MLSQSIYRIADKIIYQESETASPLDIDSLNDSFETAKIEAEVDFEVRIRYLEGLLNTGELTSGNLAETLKNQQFEIAKLRKENGLLKSRLVKAGEAGLKKR
jgi:flagellar biosynthesis protein FlhG